MKPITQVIPAKEWNEMKGKMEDTSLPEWQRYYAELQHFESHMESIKPHPDTYPTLAEYARALSRWTMKRAMDAPNKPGYYRANND